jgi:hypothetical protein
MLLSLSVEAVTHDWCQEVDGEVTSVKFYGKRVGIKPLDLCLLSP